MLTKNGKVLVIKKLTWNDVVNELTKINSNLAPTMRKLDVDKPKYSFYLATYPFGNKIINNKKTYLSLENGESIAFDDPMLPEELSNDLSYNPSTEDPMGIILSKNSEFYLPGEGRIQPHAIIEPGQLFGVARATDSSPNTSSILEVNLNAGSRSIFMLPKISDQVNHSKLQEKYGIKSSPPLTPQDHWSTFVELNNKMNGSWVSQIIYFPRNFIKNIHSEDWATLEVALMHMHRRSYSTWHKNSDIWSKTWHEIEQELQLNYYPMQSLATAKHLFKLAANIVPGFRPAIDDNSAPIGLLTEAYAATYNKLAKPKYSPIIMEPAKFNMQNGEPLYDSLNYASFTQNHLDLSKKKSHIALLEEIRVIAELYLKNILKNKREVQSLYSIAKNVTFEYYHSNPENYDKIKNVLLLEAEDSRFTLGKNDEFPTNAPFFKGCIKISMAY